MLSKFFKFSSLILCLFLSNSLVAQEKTSSSSSVKAEVTKIQMNASDLDFSSVNDSIKKDLEFNGGMTMKIYFEGKENAASFVKRQWLDVSNLVSVNYKEGSKILVEIWVWKNLTSAGVKKAFFTYVIDSKDQTSQEIEVPINEGEQFGSIKFKLNFNEDALKYKQELVVKDSSSAFINQQSKNVKDGSLVYVYVYTDNCPWCVRFKPEIQKLKRFLQSTRLGNLYQLRYAQQREFQALGINSFPTVLVYRNGILVDRFVGYKTWEVLRVNAIENVNK